MTSDGRISIKIILLTISSRNKHKITHEQISTCEMLMSLQNNVSTVHFSTTK